MKKNILTLIILLIVTCSFAQKIKISKGEIKLDGITIGYVEGKKPVFKIYNLEKSYKVIIELKQVEPVPAIPIMQLKNEATGKLNEIAFTSGKFNPFNNEKSVVNALLEHNYLNIDGLNTEAVEKFINGEPTGVSEKLLSNKRDSDKMINLINSYQLTIDDRGIIYSIKAQNPDPLDKRIGYIKMTSPSTNGELKYEVTDLDGYLIATWFAKGGMYSNYDKFLNQELITFDNKVFKAEFDNRGNPIGYKMSKDITAMNIVRTLIGNGNILQHQGITAVAGIRQEQAKNTANKITAEKKESKNFYEQSGYIINEKGEKKTGRITAEFESIKAESSSGMADMTAYGKTVTLKYTNEKGRQKTENYKSKNGIRFCIDKEGKEECYLGLKTIGNTLAAAGSLNSLSFYFSSFYKILYENKGYLVLVDPLLPSDFIIKIANQQKGLYTNKSSVDKLKKNVSDYFKCDSFEFENYDFKTLEGLIKVLKDYKNDCKK